MTPDNWRACSDPQAMLTWLREQGKLSGRKARLFAVAAGRRVDECLIDETRRLLEVAEQVAEGAVDPPQRRLYRGVAMRAGWHPDRARTQHARGPAKAAVFWALARQPYQAGRRAAWYAHAATVQVAALRGELNTSADWRANDDARRVREHRVQADLLRDLINPFHTTLFDPALRTPSVVALATTIYESRDFSRMADLAALLEAAGVADDELLGHMKGDGPFVRGDWVVDLILGRE